MNCFKNYVSIILLTISFTIPYSVFSQNLIKNSNFSGGCTNWIEGNGCTSAEIGGGNCTNGSSRETTYGGTDPNNIVAEIDAASCITQNVCILKGQQYYMEFKGSRRTSGGANGTVSVTVSVMGVTSGTIYFTQNYSFTNTAFAYTTNTATFAIPLASTDNNIYFSVKPYNMGTSTYGTIIDDIVLQPLTAYTINAPAALCANVSGNFSVNGLSGVTSLYNWNFTSGSPATSTVAAPSVTWSTMNNYTYSVDITNGSCTSATLNSSIAISCILPVDFLDLSANNIDGITAIQWKVANEVNLSKYDVEMSLNGLDFSSIGVISPNNSTESVKTYRFQHPTKQLQTETVYYRIKSTDIDGTTKYSTIATVKISLQVEFTINPNPATDFLIIKFLAANKTTGNIRIFDNSGKQVLFNLVSATKGYNTINISLLNIKTNGMFYCMIDLGELVITKKILIGNK